MYLPLKYASGMEEHLNIAIEDHAYEFAYIANTDLIYDYMFSPAFGNLKLNRENFGAFGLINELMADEKSIEGKPNSFIKKYMTKKQRYTEWREVLSMIRTAHKWCQNKIVYQIDPFFEKELIKTKGVKVPYSILKNLPYDCFFVEFAAGTLFADYVGFFVNVYILKSGELSIAINRITSDEVCYHNFLVSGDRFEGFGVKNEIIDEETYLVLDPDSICLDGVSEDTMKHNTNLEAEDLFICQFLLYLCSDKSDILLSEESRKTYKEPKVIKNKYSEIRKYEVGFKLGKAFKEFEEKEIKRYVSDGNGTPKRPHIRRAHWSTYHIGKGRTESVLRWINQIMIHEELGE